jgi:hypothetical protein
MSVTSPIEIFGALELAGAELPLLPPLELLLPHAVAPTTTVTMIAAQAIRPGLRKPFTSSPLVALR